jgi:hypothetical protein
VLLRVLSRDQHYVSERMFDLLNWQILKTEAAFYLGEMTANIIE